MPFISSLLITLKKLSGKFAGEDVEGDDEKPLPRLDDDDDARVWTLLLPLLVLAAAAAAVAA